MSAVQLCNVMVCLDCYFAHHYGRTFCDDSCHPEGAWFAGESDTPSDCPPLDMISSYELADNTDADTGDGIETFSSSRCEGCGSHLAGERYRLALFES